MTEHQATTAVQRLDEMEIDARVEDLLSGEHPLAIAAINRHGLFIPLPATVELRGHRALTGYASALDLATPADAQAVIAAWERALAHGAATVEVRLARAEQHAATLHLIDTTHRYGAFLGLVELAVGAEDAMHGGDDNPALRPRVGWLRKDSLAMVVEVDDALPLMLGWSKEKFLTTRSLDFLDPDDHNRAISSWMSMLAEPGCRRRTRLRHRHADGSWRWFEVTNHNRLHDPEHSDVFAEMVDVTDEMEAQEALRARENLLRRLTETLPVGLLQFDVDGRVLYRNDRLTAMMGGVEAATVREHVERMGAGHRREVLHLVGEVLRGAGDRSAEVAVTGADGVCRRFTIALRALNDGDGTVTGAIACVTDITESAELREQLADRATYDSLTRCENRASILATLQARLSRAAGSGVGVVFVDLDGFKGVNDGFGHVAGDRVLVEAARRLAAGVRRGDVVGRLGGDEFLVVCSDVNSRAVAMRIAKRVARALNAEPPLGGPAVVVRASIGVAWSASDATTADALVAEADQAMYESKHDGQGVPVVRDLTLLPPLPRQRMEAEVSDGAIAASASAPGSTARSRRG